MAVPKKKTSKSRRNQRRSHDGLCKINLAIDKESGEHKLSHHMDLKSGQYKGMQIISRASISN